MTNKYYLSRGGHERREDGMCAMEWVAYLAGEPHSDRPQCVSPVLTDFCITLNDGLSAKPRQRLHPYLLRMIGTRGDGRDGERQEIAADWLVRTWVPTWLELAGLDEAARRLRSLPPVTGLESVAGELRMVHATREAARLTATREAVREAVRLTATGRGLMAASGGWAAARIAKNVAALDVADVALEAALAAALDSVSGETLWTAIEDGSGGIMWGVEPTVKQLQDSVFGLLDRMLPAEPILMPAGRHAEDQSPEAGR